MTQSWGSQQTLGAENAQRLFYKSKDVKQPSLHPKHSQGDAQLRTTRLPHVAPHKSMLADDLKLSSDDEDIQTVSQEPAWDGHSRAALAQRALPHGRRVRHSSSDSSDSNSSESSTSSLRSGSSSPEGRPQTGTPSARDPCCSKEIDQPFQWQLDKWWSQARKKPSGGDHNPSENVIPGHFSPIAQRAPSPAHSWDSNGNYSPRQSPILAPHFGDRLAGSPGPSPGYSFCPSPSYNSSPRSSPVLPSPVLSLCPSPCGSPRVESRNLSPPRSPSPTLKPSRRKHREVLNQQHPGIKPGTWNEQLPNTEIRNRNPAGSNEQLHKSRLKSRHTQNQSHSRSRPDTSFNHNHSSRPNYLPSSKPVSETSKSRQPTAHGPFHKQNSHISFEQALNNSSHPQPKTLNSKPRPSQVPASVHVLKSSLKKPESKQQQQQDPEYVEVEGRQRKKRSLQENQQSKGEKRESRRLAEEQLRRTWIHSSEERYDEEEGVTERKKEREHRKKEHQQRQHPWNPTQVKPKSSLHHRAQEQKHNKAKKERTRAVSPCASPAPPSPAPSSTGSSSSAESESESQAPVTTKVPADSTSQRPVRARVRDPKPRSQPLRVLGQQQNESRPRLYTLVPFGRGEKSAGAAQRGLGNLVVQIDLCLLKRVPDGAAKKPQTQTSSAVKDKQREAMRHLCASDGKRKRKMENGAVSRESKRSVTYANESSGPANDNRIVTETIHNGSLDGKMPLSPLSDNPEFTKCGSQTKTSEKSRDKSREIKPKLEVESVKVSRNTKPPTESWSSSGNRGTGTLSETQHHAEYYLHEAKRMKHRADAMVDKLGKAVNYVDAALSFMECGKAMEQGPLEAKSPYTMYAETVELIRYAMRLKSHSGPGARQEDKQLAVLCFRCLALLYWQMFRLKKDHALKYSKVLLDFFKSSPKVPASAACWSDSGKVSGEHPSLSPNSKRCSWGSPGANTFINIPHRIHQMAANHLNITNSVLYSYEYWEVADSLAKENTEFFNYLNTLSGPLTLHSSISHAVQYMRQALQWIRISAKLN